MNFGVLDLFDWLKPKHNHPYHDLASSGVTGPATLADLGIRLDDIPVTGENLYGYPPLRELLASKFGVKPDQVAITPGASMANFVVMTALLQGGGDALMETPVYRPFPAIAEALLERKPRFFRRRFEEKYRLDVDNVYADSGDPALTILTNLHNPSGVLTPQEEIVRLADETSKRGGWMLLDEIFLPFINSHEWRTAAALHSRIIATGSLTKVWGLSGLRIGWIIASPDLIYRFQRLMDYMHVVQPLFSEVAAYRILEGGMSDRLLSQARRTAAENLPLVEAALAKLPGLEAVKPDGGIVIFVRRSDGKSTEAFTERLFRESNVLVQPGRYFGEPAGFRIGFSSGEAALKVSLELFSHQWLKEIN